MSILIKGISMPKDGEFLDLVINADGKVACYDAEDRKIADAVEVPDYALIWGTDSDGVPVLMLVHPKNKDEKDEHIDQGT